MLNSLASFSSNHAAIARPESSSSAGAQVAQSEQQTAVGEILQQTGGLTSILLHRQQLLSQLYFTTATICQRRDQISPADWKAIIDQAPSLRWCSIQQESLCPTTTVSSNDSPAATRVRREVAIARLTSQINTSHREMSFSRYDVDIARRISLAKPRVLNYRYLPKKVC